MGCRKSVRHVRHRPTNPKQPRKAPTVSLPTPTHTTRTVTAKVVSVWCYINDNGPDTIEVTLEVPVEAERHQSWRFVVADAAPYPVGSTITLEVPA